MYLFYLNPLVGIYDRWCNVRGYRTPNAAACAASALRSGRYDIPAGKWEFASRGCDLYARYLGGGDERDLSPPEDAT